MRVNIGYSCSLEDVQEEIANFLERASLKLNHSAAITEKNASLAASENYDAQVALLGIHEVRVMLNKIDLRLEDLATLVVGLENAKKKVADEAAAAELAAQEEEKPPAVTQLVAEPVKQLPEVSNVKGPVQKKKGRGRKKKGKG